VAAVQLSGGCLAVNLPLNQRRSCRGCLCAFFLANTHYVIKKNWHQRHFDTLGFGSRLADAVAKSMGS
jgi:hypothetical protein